MMTKRMLSLTAAVLAALMLCACAAGTARADGDVPSFGNMEYTRPDPAALEACVISAEDALDAGEIRLLRTGFDIAPRSVDMCTLRDVSPTAAAAAFMEMVRSGDRT